tara:strand:+ start:231 stop:719 length:489 start_codon:yes stop_codon:yes gene_type:complete
VSLAPDDVLGRVRSAYRTLLARDRYLFEIDVNERSLTHKLAEYLQQHFPEWNVDCEYNRWADNPNGNIQKQLDGLETQVLSTDANGTTVYPDIIVHLRGTSENLVVIEAKKGRGDLERDRRKLALYRNQLGYTHAVAVIFPANGDSATADPEDDVALWESDL